MASMAWKLHAIEQKQLRRQHRVDGVGRPKFDFHTVANKLKRKRNTANAESIAARTVLGAQNASVHTVDQPGLMKKRMVQQISAQRPKTGGAFGMEASARLVT